MSLLKRLIIFALSSNEDERIQLIDSIKTYADGRSKDLASKQEEIKINKYNKTLQIMINFNDITKGNIKEHTLNWPQIPDHP